MSDLYLDLDLSELEDLTNQQEARLYKRLSDVAQKLSAATLAHIKEQVDSQLHSSRKKYLDNLSLDQVEEGLWVIKLKKEAVWIDDGLPSFSLLPGLLNSPNARIAKDGHKYVIVPFKHNKDKQELDHTGQDLSEALKQALKNRHKNWKKIARNDDGTAKMGLLNKYNLSIPRRLGASSLSLGASGPKGRPYRANSLPGSGGLSGPEGRPYLFGVRIYQTPIFNENGFAVRDNNGHIKVQRGIFTFRVASEKQLGHGMWEHPGYEGKNFMDSAFDWAVKEWESTIKPEILRNFQQEE